ncbi:MAG: RDD family protein, partial [Candidatus Bathyarchaeia archaeon]
MRACAGIESRLLAGIVDFVITLAIALLIFLFIFPLSFGSISTPWSLLGEPLSLALFGLLSAVSVVYFTFFEASTGQTPGKKAVAIKVVGDDGIECSVYRILLRNVARIVDFLPAFYILGLIS